MSKKSKKIAAKSLYVQVEGEVKAPEYTTTTTSTGGHKVFWKARPLTSEQLEEAHPTEVKFPNQCGTFKMLMKKSYETHLIKNEDYSPANITIMGETGVIVRIWDKFCRICNLKGIPFPCVGPDLRDLQAKLNVKIAIAHSEGKEELEKELHSVYAKLSEIEKKSEFNFSLAKEKEAAVKDEALEDTWLDLMTYAIIGNIFRKGNWGR